ncbi:MAG: TAT-variant-translocated molybdopterin oxidoreductase [Candidatus Sumerlaeaceae bacterium]
MSSLSDQKVADQVANAELPVRRPLSMEEVRERLAAHGGPRYWRSLDELAQSPAFHELLKQEFPTEAERWVDPVSRRQFLQLMAASLALAGLSACVQRPRENIVPYSTMPELVAESKPLFFATAFELRGYAQPILVESHFGRPTKIEGNPDHPMSRGAASAWAQASVLDLYDPDRVKTITHGPLIEPWSEFVSQVRPLLEKQKSLGGRGVRIVTPAMSSPTMLRLLEKFLRDFPEAKWISFEPISRDAAYQGASLAFGKPVETIYDFLLADRVVAFESDFLFDHPAAIAHAKDFAPRRKVGAHERGLNRFYAVESFPTCTGTAADHRLALPSTEICELVFALAKQLGMPVTAPDLPPDRQHWVNAVADDLLAHRAASAVVVGDSLPPEVHALGHAINHHLGNVGKTVAYVDAVQSHPGKQSQLLAELASEIEQGRVELLITLGLNLLAVTPPSLHLAENLERVGIRIHASTHRDETASVATWHVPVSHYLEAWCDTRCADGSAVVVQPLIAPLYGTKSFLEIMAMLTGLVDKPGYELVREYWREHAPAGKSFEDFWRASLHDGVIDGTKPQPSPLALKLDLASLKAPAKQASELAIVLRPDPSVYDGRFANNGWLQELPKPVTKLTWDNAIHIAPAMAARLNVRDDDILEISTPHGRLEGSAIVVPGHADRCITVHLGYGRKAAGRVGNDRGFNALLLCSSPGQAAVEGATVKRTGKRGPLARTQMHFNMENRHLVRTATLEEYQRDPHFVAHVAHEPPPASLYPPHKYDGYAWGMVIDLAACIGCNACVVACHAENNIPVVGKDQVLRSREMHWIRIDQYFEGEPATPVIHNQPVNCMQCENAPCEPVCPVQATVHDSEGLNAMVYNRCLGTRYCANNCPYKVRRFNFLEYQDWKTPTLKLVRNPDVTVRQRGVMEKCTYCVERISQARIAATNEGREIRDGDILTACQATCPTDAIVFGNLNDPQSAVAKLKASPLNYGLLTELNTRPRTTYLGSVRNPNPKLILSPTNKEATTKHGVA